MWVFEREKVTFASLSWGSRVCLISICPLEELIKELTRGPQLCVVFSHLLQNYSQCVWDMVAQVGQVLEHPGLVEGAHAHGRGWHWKGFKVPSDPNQSVLL